MLIKEFTPLKVPRGILLAAALAAFLLAVAAVALSQPASAQVDEDDRFAVLIPYQVTDTTAKVKIAECVPDGDVCSLPVEAEGEEGSNLADYLDTWHSPHLSDWYGEFSIYVFDDSDPDNYPFPVHCNDDRGRNRFERSAEFEGLQPNTTYQMNMLPGTCDDNAIANVSELQDAFAATLLAVTDMGLGEPTLTTLAAQTSNIVVVNPPGPPAMRIFRVGPWGFRVEVENWDKPWSVRAVTSQTTNGGGQDRCIEGDGDSRRNRLARFEYSDQRGDFSLANNRTYTVTLSDQPCNKHDSDDPLASLTQSTTDISIRASHVGARSARIVVDGRRETDSAWSWYLLIYQGGAPVPAYNCIKVTGDWFKLRNLKPATQYAFQISHYGPNALFELECSSANLEPETFMTKSLVGFSLNQRSQTSVKVDITNPPSGNYYWSSSASGCQRVPNNDQITLGGLTIESRPLIGIYLTPQCGWDASEGIESTNPDRFGAQNVYRAPKHSSAPQIAIDVQGGSGNRFIEWFVDNWDDDFSFRVERVNNDQTVTPVVVCNEFSPNFINSGIVDFTLPDRHSKYRIAVYDEPDCSRIHFDVITVRTN